MPAGIVVWAVRGLTVLGGALLLGGVLILSAMFPPNSALANCSNDSPVCTYALPSAVALLPLGLATSAIGVSLQKRMHDEWGFNGIHNFVRGPRKWAKCGHCGTIVRADTRICPSCGERKLLTPVVISTEEAGIRAMVSNDRSDWDWDRKLRGECLVEFEGGHMFLEEPGKDLVLIEPKKILRTSSLTLLLDTGRWGLTAYGKITLTFESDSDADTVEREANKLVESSWRQNRTTN